MAGKWSAEKMARWVTVYADAGYKKGQAKLGWVLRGSHAPTWAEGSKLVSAASSVEAEALACLHAVRDAYDLFDPNMPQPMEGVFLRCDCIAVVRAVQREMNGAGSNTRSSYGKPIADLGLFARNHELHIMVKHVRAHGKAHDRIQRWMNDKADSLGNMRVNG